MLEWRNWQTHGTQNPAPFTGHVGSTPTSSTKETNYLIGYRKLVNLSIHPKNSATSGSLSPYIVRAAFAIAHAISSSPLLP